MAKLIGYPSLGQARQVTGYDIVASDTSVSVLETEIFGSNQSITASLGALTLTGRQATVVTSATYVTANLGALTLTGRQATVVPGSVTIAASVRSLTLTPLTSSIITNEINGISSGKMEYWQAGAFAVASSS